MPLSPLRDYKYKSRFVATAKCLLDESKGKLLAKASFDDLKALLPANWQNQPDLLPISGACCVTNLSNGNGDLLPGKIGLRVYKNFTSKFLDVEHSRDQCCGLITNAVLTQYSPNYAEGSGLKVISEDGLKDFDLYNIVIVGYIWRYVAPNVIEKILESNDPSSELYLSVALSWEIAFDRLEILLGASELGDPKGELITDQAEIEKYEPYLKSNGGSGRLLDGRTVIRVIADSYLEDGSLDVTGVLPLGAACTFSPAGQVSGLITPFFELSPTLIEAQNQENIEKDEKNISQASIQPVTNNTYMKSFKSLSEVKAVNDETAKEYSFANIANIVDSEMQVKIQEAMAAADKAWGEKVENEKNAAIAALKKVEEAQARIDELNTKLDETSKKLADVEGAHLQAVATQKFNDRMSHFDDKYELTDADRKALASRIKSLDDNGFKDFAENEFAVFAVDKNKEALAAKKMVSDKEKQDAADKKAADDKKAEDDKSKEGKTEAKASLADATEAKRVAAEALANASMAKNSIIPNVLAPVSSLKSKYEAAFSKENVKFTEK